MQTRTKRFAVSLSAAMVALTVLCFVPVGYAEGATDPDASAAAATDSATETTTPATDKGTVGTPEHPVAVTNVATVTTPAGATTSYTTLPEAVAAATAGSTITLWSDVDLPASSVDGVSLSLKMTEGVTVNGNGHTLTVHGRGIYLFGTDDADNPASYTFRNITITNPDGNGRTVSARDGYKTLRFIDATLSATGAGNTMVVTMGGNTPDATEVTFVASTVTASEAGYGIITFNPVHLTLSDTQVSGYAALYMKGPDSSAGSSHSRVDINSGSILTSNGIVGPTNSFGTIVFQQCDDIAVNVTDSTVNATAADDTSENAATQSVILFSNVGVQDDTASKNDTVTFGEGSVVNATGANSQLASSNGQENAVDAEGGTYHIDGKLLGETPSADIPQTSLVVTGGNWNKDVASYVPEGYNEHASGDAGTPYAIGEGAAPDTGDGNEAVDEPTTGTTDDGSDSRATDGTGDTTGTTDDSTTSGTGADDQSGTTANTATDAEGGTNNGTDENTSATGTAHTNGTHTSGTTARTSNFKTTVSADTPQTDDSNPLLPFALGAASTSLVMLAAMLIYRKRADQLR